MAIAWLMISDALIQNIIRERYRNIKHQIMVSGSSLIAYWLGHYIADILVQGVPTIIAIAGVYAFDIDVPQVWALFLVHVFASPAFLYFLSFLFEKEESGSLFIKMVFFVVGIIAPIATSILQIFPNTVNIANGLRWGFYPFPIFSLVFGYISIANAPITQFLNNLTEVPKPYDMLVAGPALYFLLGSIVFYWLLVIAFEMKVFDRLLCLNRAAAPATGTSSFRAHDIDEDVIEEAARVEQMAPKDLPVRMSNLHKNYGGVKAVRDVSFGLEYGECFALLGISGAGKTTCFKCMTGEIYPSKG